MAIPIFAPNIDFMTRHHVQYSFVSQKTTIYKSHNHFPNHPAYNGTARVRLANPQIANPSYDFLDPRNNQDSRVVRYWLSMTDYLTYPHVVQFDSAEKLVEILQALWEQPSRLHAISAAMRETNRSRLKSLVLYWRRRLMDIAEYSPHHPE